MKSLDVLINTLNSILETLNNNDYKIYDNENRDFYMNKIAYCNQEDRLFVTFKEDKK